MYLLVDIGGTNTRVATASDHESFGESVTFPTPKLFADGLDVVVKASEKLVRDSSIDCVIVGVAGPLTRDKSGLLNAPNLPDWVGRALKSELSNRLSSDVVLFNDADLVGLGEAHFGAGKGHAIVAYVTVSTGVGGSRIVNGEVDSYALGFEPGHMLLDETHTFENLAGGVSLQRVHGMMPEDIDDPSVWETQSKIVARGVHNVIVLWSPDIVVLGGSQMNKIMIDVVRDEVDRLLHIFPEAPEISVGQLGGEGGLWGALSVVKGMRTISR